MLGIACEQPYRNIQILFSFLYGYMPYHPRTIFWIWVAALCSRIIEKRFRAINALDAIIPCFSVCNAMYNFYVLVLLTGLNLHDDT